MDRLAFVVYYESKLSSVLIRCFSLFASSYQDGRKSLVNSFDGKHHNTFLARGVQKLFSTKAPR